MRLRAAAVGALSLALILGTSAGAESPPRSQDQEAKLISKIAREKNPVKKAKLETKLGRLKMQKAFSAYDQGHYGRCWKLLDEYLVEMNEAWSELVASGHRATRKPDGFKQLEIALRESRRDLQDFETRISYSERQAAEKITSRTVALRNQVLDALFPGAAPPKKKGSLAVRETSGTGSRKRPQ